MQQLIWRYMHFDDAISNADERSVATMFNRNTKARLIKNFSYTFERMKYIQAIAWIMIYVVVLGSCKKTSFITSPDAFLLTSADTLHFNTVFTSVGSVTQSVKIFNLNDAYLRLNKIILSGGSGSPFRINVNGTGGTTFSNIEIAPNDSIYVFVTVTIDPDANENPFLVQDSISIEYNGNTNFIQLDAYGRNAVFLRNATITKDTAWNSNLPVVVIGPLTVTETATLTINKGTQVFCHADAYITVNGSLNVKGEQGGNNKVTFTNDRLDEPYRYFPGSWPGISFTETSKKNKLKNLVLINAKKAISVSGYSAETKLSMEQCIIDNISDTAIAAYNTSISATNCLITNCGQNIALINGGDYHFTHCTVASYANVYFNHLLPVLSINNNSATNTNASFINSIFWGDGGITDNEIVLLNTGTGNFNCTFQNVLYKGTSVADASFQDCIEGQDPLFVLLDFEHLEYNFRLQEPSPCINAGKITSVKDDLAGNTRDFQPDMGCYEY